VGGVGIKAWVEMVVGGGDLHWHRASWDGRSTRWGALCFVPMVWAGSRALGWCRALGGVRWGQLQRGRGVVGEGELSSKPLKEGIKSKSFDDRPALVCVTSDTLECDKSLIGQDRERG